MITKSYPKTGHACRVTFTIPAEQASCERGAVLGEWNDWNPEATPLERREDGSLAATVSLPVGRSYRFRYLLDGDRWENDRAADASVPNVFGSEDSVVAVEDASAPRARKAAKPAGAKPRTAKKTAKPAAAPGGRKRTPRRPES